MKKLLSILSILLISACATSDKKEEPKTAEALYNSAYNMLEEQTYKKAAETFEKVDVEYPYSKWATNAKVMSAYAYYLNQQYDDAIITIDRFLRFHPANIQAPYAYYLKALCYYDQIQGIDKEQGNTQSALQALTEVTQRFPKSQYAKDAKAKINLAKDRIAGQSMEIGRYYLNQEAYLAALNRFSDVVKNYQTTAHIEEALYRQVEVYTILGLSSEAEHSKKALNLNYPNSEWNTKAQAL